MQEQDRALADQINNEALLNPKSPNKGKFIGILKGEVVVVTDTLDDVIDRLEELDPASDHSFWFEAGIDYNKVEYIWELL